MLDRSDQVGGNRKAVAVSFARKHEGGEENVPLGRAP